MIKTCTTLAVLGLMWAQFSCVSPKKLSESPPVKTAEQGISRGANASPAIVDGQATSLNSPKDETAGIAEKPAPEAVQKVAAEGPKPTPVEPEKELAYNSPLPPKAATAMAFPRKEDQLDSLIFRLFGEGVSVIPGSIKANLPLESGAFAYFVDTTSSMGISEGILMTNGSIQHALGPNFSKKSSHKLGTPGDPDLQRLVDNRMTYDACVIEFEVVPAGDTLAFNFVFGSEEYDEWVGSKFNDVFAFFIEGPGVEGKKNMALLPDRKTFVAINTVNGKKQAGANQGFFVGNGQNQNAQIGYDGYTRVLKIRQAVQADSTYRLKLAITDVSDPSYDSGLFLEGRSISSYSAAYQLRYAVGRYGLSRQARAQLASILQEVKSGGSKARLEIVGHADSQGEDSANLALSEKRCQAVVQYFLSRGVKEGQIRQAAWGETRPIGDNDTQQGRAKNRRVEILVMGQKLSKD
ncbi:MAG: OmpA family protein [Bacteroidota bacterium]